MFVYSVRVSHIRARHKRSKGETRMQQRLLMVGQPDEQFVSSKVSDFKMYKGRPCHDKE